MKVHSGVHELVAALSTAQPGTFLLQVAVYPRNGDTGLLQEQGQAVAQLIESVSRRVPSVGAHRILWGQVAFVVAREAAEKAKQTILHAAVAASSTEVEVRGAWCTLDGPRSERWIDDFFGELSVRRNFGTVMWIEGRMIDGVEVQA